MVKTRIAAFVLVVAITAAVSAGCGMPAVPATAADCLALGEKYLLELDYEQALVQFLNAIDIDPMNPRGYTGAAEAYVGLGRINRAIRILQQGLEELPRNSEISAMLDRLESMAADDSGEVAAAQPSRSPRSSRGAEPQDAGDATTSTYAPSTQEPEQNTPAAPESTEQPGSWADAPSASPPASASPLPPPVDVPIGVDIGMLLPDFTLSLRGGGSVTLSDLRGKPVFINVCTTWCPPCQYEFPEIQAVYETFGDSIYVIGISSYEYERDVDDYFDMFDYTYPIAYDPNGVLFAPYYDIEFIPQTWVLDANGVIVDYFAGSNQAEVFTEAVDRAFR